MTVGCFSEGYSPTYRRQNQHTTGPLPNILVLDNGQFHKAKKLVVPSNVQLTFLPPYSPELNPVERLWQDLKDQLAFDFYKHLSSLRQETRTVLRRYTDRAVASLTGYDYLLEATSVLSS